MKLSTDKLFRVVLVFFLVFLLVLVALAAAKQYLPPNSLTHECTPSGKVLFDSLAVEPTFRQGFCEQHHSVAFKDSWDHTLSGIAVSGLLICSLLLIPTGAVLLSRKLNRHDKNHKVK